MRTAASLLVFTMISMFFLSCKSSKSNTPPVFCDTACVKDSMKFTGEDKSHPYVIISSSVCHPDTLVWSGAGMDVNKKVGINDFLNNTIYLNKDYVRVYFSGAQYAWLLLNDCSNGRGYALKLPFDKNGTIDRDSRAINNMDKKFVVADNLVAYTDRGNITAEDMGTGKKAMMTFGQDLGIDFDAIHEYIDSVNITNSRIWVKVKIGKEWKELEKKITLE